MLPHSNRIDSSHWNMVIHLAWCYFHIFHQNYDMCAKSLQQPALRRFEQLDCDVPILSWIGRKGWICFLDPHKDRDASIAKGPNLPYVAMCFHEYIWVILVVLWSNRGLQSITTCIYEYSNCHVRCWYLIILHVWHNLQCKRYGILLHCNPLLLTIWLY